MADLKKTLTLNLSERVNALTILNAFKGNLDKMAVILDDIKQFTITDEEWEKADRKVTETNGSVQWNWSDEKGGEKELVVSEGVATYLKDMIKEKDGKGEFTLQDKSFITLLAKLV